MRFSPALLLSVTLLPGLLSAERALAYATPEDVLYQQMQYYQAQDYLPPNSRRVREISAEQEAARAAQHPGTFTDMGSVDAPVASSSSSASDARDTAASSSSGTAGEEPDAATLRLQERMENQEALQAGAAPQQSNPLAPTGAGTLAAIGIAVLGISLTLLKARKG